MADVATSRGRTLETFAYECQKSGIQEYLDDEDVSEIMVNPDGTLWLNTHSKGFVDTGKVLPALSVKNIIFRVAALTDQIINMDKIPALQAEIPQSYVCDAARFQAELPNIVSGPSMNIRKYTKVVLTLEDYVKNGTMTQQQYDVLMKAIKEHKNIIAAGGTNSGKTTLLNAILHEISATNDRVVMIEDTPELKCDAKNNVSFRTTEFVDMDMLLRFTLRKTPNRIVVGEIRGKEALTLLDAWSTGHRGGCSTVHADSAIDTLHRLESLVTRASLTPQNETVGRAVDMVIYIKLKGTERKIDQIIEVDGYNIDTQKYEYRVVG